jgi:hypothetical protein
MTKVITIKDINYSTAPLDCGACQPLPQPVGGNKGASYTNQTAAFLGLTINPNNSNEIVYTRVIDFINKVYYFNLKTKVHQLLYSGYIYGTPRWHSTGWLLLATYDTLLNERCLYKVKPTEGILHLLGHYDTETGATWNDTGDKVAFYPYKKRGTLYIIDAQTGAFIDSVLNIPAFYSFFDWTKPNLLTRQSGSGSIVTHHLLHQTQALIFEGQGTPGGFTWLDDDKSMIVSTATGLYITNTETQQTKKLKCACQSLDYSYPVYGRQHFKIYAIRQTLMIGNPPRNNTNIQVYNDLVQMNLDGSEERVIELPQ